MPKRPIVAVDVGDCRLYVAGRRVHHGLLGVAIVLLGLTLIWHDRADYPWPPGLHSFEVRVGG